MDFVRYSDDGVGERLVHPPLRHFDRLSARGLVDQCDGVGLASEGILSEWRHHLVIEESEVRPPNESERLAAALCLHDDCDGM